MGAYRLYFRFSMFILISLISSFIIIPFYSDAGEQSRADIFSISGRVVDSTNKTLAQPVEGINVTIALNATHSLYDHTASDGSFTISDVPVGSYKVKAEDDYYYSSLRYSAAGSAASVDVDVMDSDVSLTLDLVVIEQDLPVYVDLPKATTGVAVDTMIQFSFKESMNVSSVTSYTDLIPTLGGKAVNGTWLDATNDKMTFTFDPNSDLESNESYTLTMNTAVRSEDAEKVLWKYFKFTFVTEEGTVEPPDPPDPPLTPLTAIIDVASDIIDTDITVTFSAAMNQTKTETAITITADDDTAGTNLVINYEWLENVVILEHYDFDYDINYTVTVGADAEADDGRTLGIAVSRSIIAQSINGNHFWTLLLGPFTDSDNNFIEGAKVTITVDGKEYSGTTDSVGIATIELDEQPAAGTYKVKVTKDGYEDIEYNLDIDDTGLYNPLPPPPPPSKKDFPWMIFLITLAILIPIIVILILAVKARKSEVEAIELDRIDQIRKEQLVCQNCGEYVGPNIENCPRCGVIK